MLIIADRINAYQKHIAQAIVTKNAPFIQNEVKAQALAGADYIDINTGIFERKIESLKWVLEVVQNVTDLPLSLDCRDADVTKSLLSIIKRKPILNTITMSLPSLKNFFSLVVEQRAKVILRSNGGNTHKESWNGRLRYLENIVNLAKAKGIPLDDLYIAFLPPPLLVDHRSAVMTLNSIQRVIKEFPGIHTICDLNSISRGLPGRNLLNRTFLVAAIVHGLDSVLMDPTDRQLFGTVKAALLVAGSDEKCIEYIRQIKKYEFD